MPSVNQFEQRASFSRRQLQLLDAAVRLVDRVGIGGFTMRSLAAEVSLSPMAAYKHFENQRALQLQVFSACQSRLYDALLEATDEPPDPATAFLRFCRTFVEHAVRYPYRYELLYNHPFVHEIRQVPELEQLRQSVWTYALELVSRARKAGLFRDDLSAELLSSAAASHIRGLASVIIYQSSEPVPLEEAHASIESGMAFLREGLMAR
ncbi:MAG: AcrR family transcriptional regulator [Bradymonadia bacterium]|jgi:AcrR family transcriptional regulator